MTKTILFKFIASISVLSLAAACASGNDNGVRLQGVPQVEPILENAPLEIDENYIEPTRNEMNDNFGTEIDGDVERDIPNNYLEKDEETESSE